MKKYFIACFYIAFSFSNLFGQIYISDKLDSILILGPKNVKYEGEEIVKIYSNEYEKIIEEINEKIYFSDSITNLMNNKPKLKRREKRELRKLKRESEKWNLEKEIINEFKEMWMKRIIENELLAELFYLDSIGECVDIETESGSYKHFEYEIERKELINQIYFTETLPFSLVYPKGGKGSRWVKKKSGNNCISTDPEDCFIWCLEEYIIKKYKFLNYLDEEIILDKCPVSYTLSIDNNICEREFKHEIIDNPEYIIKLISKKDNKYLKLKSMIVVDCKD